MVLQIINYQLLALWSCQPAGAGIYLPDNHISPGNMPDISRVSM
jgi:hypothetical protein